MFTKLSINCELVTSCISCPKLYSGMDRSMLITYNLCKAFFLNLLKASSGYGFFHHPIEFLCRTALGGCDGEIDLVFWQVFKGKKMPGRMGGDQVTVKNVWVYKIHPARNLIWVRGQVCFCSCRTLHPMVYVHLLLIVLDCIF